MQRAEKILPVKPFSVGGDYYFKLYPFLHHLDGRDLMEAVGALPSTSKPYIPQAFYTLSILLWRVMEGRSNFVQN